MSTLRPRAGACDVLRGETRLFLRGRGRAPALALLPLTRPPVSTRRSAVNMVKARRVTPISIARKPRRLVRLSCSPRSPAQLPPLALTLFINSPLAAPLLPPEASSRAHQPDLGRCRARARAGGPVEALAPLHPRGPLPQRPDLLGTHARALRGIHQGAAAARPHRQELWAQRS